MERQFLIKYFIILIALGGCQQLELSNSNIDIDNSQKSIKNSSNNNNTISDEVVIPYLNIWEYLIKNASSNEEIINNQILFHMNSHLKDVDKFSDLIFLYIGIFSLNFTLSCILDGTPALSRPNKIVSSDLNLNLV